ARGPVRPAPAARSRSRPRHRPTSARPQTEPQPRSCSRAYTQRLGANIASHQLQQPQQPEAGRREGAPDPPGRRHEFGRRLRLPVAAGRNIAGRFLWASLSDKIGRKLTYFTFFTLGFICYAAAPTLATLGMLGLFAAAFCVIASMYGGGFATIPAYLADIFGTQYVGAIHGRLLTAWSTAGIVGPVVV